MSPQTIAHILAGVAFLSFAAVQYNDPDPALWMGIYGLAALISFAASIGKAIPPLASMLGVTSLAGATVIFRAGFGEGNLLDSETFREMGGLLVVAGWMGFVVFQSLRAAGEAASEAGEGT